MNLLQGNYSSTATFATYKIYKMKNILLSVAVLTMALISKAQCDTVLISPSNYSVHSISSENGTNTGDKTFDSDNNSRWRTKGGTDHEIVVDLGALEDVTAMSYKTRWSGSGKINTFELFATNISTQWGSGEQFGVGDYSKNNTSDTIYFGAINGRYIKLKCTSTSGDIQLSELRFFKNTCPSAGKLNQPIRFTEIAKKETNSQPIQLVANANGPGTISYSIVSGPATVTGSILNLTKQAGKVVVRASVSGTTSRYENSTDIAFGVIDLATYNPTMSTRLTESFPIELADSNGVYMIYIDADIVEKDFLSIDKIEVEIEGEITKAREIIPGSYYLAWKPKSFKSYTLNMTTKASNGQTATLSKTIDVVEGGVSKTVTSLDTVVIEFQTANSRDYYGSHDLPQFVGTYDKVIAKLNVECPNGNCDDWDRWAHFDIKAPGGNWIQIIRYMTPYNVGCNHEIDVTEYASLLQGEVDFHVFIDTWGTGGWKLTLDFEYVKGTPKYTYSTLTEVWDGAFDFGNIGNLEPVPQKEIFIPRNTEEISLVMSTSGHGWGQNNTGNAAEFYHAKHDLLVNGSKEYVQDLWNDCDPNPDNCLNQQGTWPYDRAGWCPGAIAPPNIVNLSAFKNSSSIELDYKFQSNYRDFCHPNNPNCISGSTCADCNAGYNPHYNVDVHAAFFGNEPMAYGVNNRIIEFSTAIEESASEYNFTLFPNPNNGRFHIQIENFNSQVSGALYSVDGTQHKRYSFSSVEELEGFEFDISNLESGVYFLELTDNTSKGFKRIVLQ